jgi:hypothetical protein
MTTNMYGLHEQEYANGETVQGRIVFNCHDRCNPINYETDLTAKQLIQVARDRWQLIADNELEDWDAQDKPKTLAQAVKFMQDIDWAVKFGFVGTLTDIDDNVLISNEG